MNVGKGLIWIIFTDGIRSISGLLIIGFFGIVFSNDNSLNGSRKGMPSPSIEKRVGSSILVHRRISAYKIKFQVMVIFFFIIIGNRKKN